MEIILICDGALPLDSPVRKLPLFFAARLIDMSRVSQDTVGEASLAVVELLGSSEAGLTALKASWQSIAEIPVICLASKSNRREMIQAAALGKSQVVDRDINLQGLLATIREGLAPAIEPELPEGTTEDIRKAFESGKRCLELLGLSATTDAPVPMKVLENGATDLLEALEGAGLSAWLEAVQHHHSQTYSHVMMVSGLAGAFAGYLGWTDDDCREVVVGGLIHDIGKMRIPLTILDKTEELTPKERELVKKHVVFGQEILKSHLEVPIDVKKMAMQHHEYLDGSGYPNKLKAERITPKVRLMTICDIFVALVEERAYKESIPPRTAIGLMREMGPKLDQKMLAKFAEMIVDRSLGEISRPVNVTGNTAA